MKASLKSKSATDAGTDTVPGTALAALDSLRVAITVFDSDQALIYANRHYSHMFPFMPPRDSLLGLHYEAIVRREIAGGAIAPCITDIEGFVAERRAQFRDDAYTPMDVPLADGRIVEIKVRRTPHCGWIALWTDVTQARHTLQQLEDAIELSADAFAFYDPADRLMACNAEFAQIIGAASPQQAVGLSLAEVLDSAAGNGVFMPDSGLENWIAYRLNRRSQAAGIFTVATRSGASYLVRDRTTRDGGRAVVFTNVTDSRRIEAALDEQTKALERTRVALARSKTEAQKQARYLADLSERLGAAKAEAGTAKTTFLRTMSHELKTPLNAIIGFADLLRSAPGRFTPEQVGEYATLIHAAGGNLLRLLNQILDLTRIAAGRFELHCTKLDTLAAIRAAIDTIAAEAEASTIAIDESGAAAQIEVFADEGALGTMLRHLLENAIHFAPPKSTVRLLTEQQEGRIAIGVTDEGPGVAAEDLARILEPFEQAGRGTADHKEGAGLGLTLVKALAELHGGGLHLESVPGQGFTATLTLPAG